MRTALINGFRTGAEPGLVGECPGCGAAMLSKCGKRRIWHWAHRGGRHCDHWWEPETEWHVNWKNRFPIQWQENVRWAEDGEKHIADIMAPDGRVIEFQHSPIDRHERGSREAFYRSMVWVIDGLSRKRDQKAFANTLYRLNLQAPVYSGHSLECALLRDWEGNTADVFFDFGARNEDITTFGAPILWHLHPNTLGRILLTPVATDFFVKAFLDAKPLPRILVKPNPPTPGPVLPVSGYPGTLGRYLWHQAKRRRRF
ncbi:competence protein CoiA family protein [Ferrovibrio sp.]|uniref:competence protein CoiA n=1 Tax=Ferrovibrio sp. TaxID=1917215 RepID=UPI00311DDCF5